ncbi:MAG: DUF2294 family protein [Planctomycetes bacterium]|nr:DUF2294 family protein [Planctomycetota bacterium]
MDEPSSRMAKQIGQAASDYEYERTGHRPTSVTVVLTGDTLVVSLPGVMSRVEMDLAKNPAGAACVREFHRQVFANSCGPLRQAIESVTGVKVREGRSELWTETGKVVQMFLLADSVTAGTWSGNGLKGL